MFTLYESALCQKPWQELFLFRRTQTAVYASESIKVKYLSS